MPVRTEVDTTTTSSGTTVEGTVVDGGGGGTSGYKCDVALIVDADKLTLKGTPTPSSGLLNATDGYVLWTDVEVPSDPGVAFEAEIEWKSGAKGSTLVQFVAIDRDNLIVSSDVIWLKKPKKGGVGKKALLEASYGSKDMLPAKAPKDLKRKESKSKGGKSKDSKKGKKKKAKK